MMEDNTDSIESQVASLARDLQAEREHRAALEHYVRSMASMATPNQNPSPEAPPPTAAASMSISLRPDKPPTFSGRTGERADTLLFINVQYFSAVGLLDPAQQIIHAASRFRDNAAVWWQHLQQLILRGLRQSIDNWDTFQAAMLAEFQPMDNIKTARDKLADLSQRTSVATYASCLRDLAIQIPDLSPGDLLHKFNRGLKPNIRREVELRDPTTLDEAIKLAERVDTIDYSMHRSSRRPPAFHRPSTGYNGPVPMELGAMEYSSQARRTSNGPGPRYNKQTSFGAPERRRDMTKVQCYNCQGYGHFARDCRKPPTARDGQGMLKGPRQQ